MPTRSSASRGAPVARTDTTSPLCAPVVIVRSSAIEPSSRISAHTTNASYTPSSSGISTNCMVARVTVFDTDSHCAKCRPGRCVLRTAPPSMCVRGAVCVHSELALDARVVQNCWKCLKLRSGWVELSQIPGRKFGGWCEQVRARRCSSLGGRWCRQEGRCIRRRQPHRCRPECCCSRRQGHGSRFRRLVAHRACGAHWSQSAHRRARSDRGIQGREVLGRSRLQVRREQVEMPGESSRSSLPKIFPTKGGDRASGEETYSTEIS